MLDYGMKPLLGVEELGIDSESDLRYIIRLAVKYAGGRDFVDYSDMNDNYLHQTPDQLSQGQDYYDSLAEGWDPYDLQLKSSDNTKPHEQIREYMPKLNLNSAHYVCLNSHVIWWGAWSQYYGRTIMVIMISGNTPEKSGVSEDYFFVFEELGSHEATCYEYLGMLSMNDYYQKEKK
jgi:hypothetical protein